MTAQSSITHRRMIGGVAAGVGLVATVASRDIIGEAHAQSTSKNFVGGWYWRRVSDLLQAKGHRVFSPTLTGLGERSQSIKQGYQI